MQGNVSQILYLSLSSNSMTQNGKIKLFFFIKDFLHFIDLYLKLSKICSHKEELSKM